VIAHGSRIVLLVGIRTFEGCGNRARADTVVEETMYVVANHVA